MDAFNVPTGVRSWWPLFFAAVGALVVLGCGNKTGASVSPGDAAPNSTAGTEAGQPGTAASGAGGSDATGGAAVVGTGGNGRAGSEATAGGGSGERSGGFSAIAVGLKGTYAIRDSSAYRLDSNGFRPIAGLASGVTAIASATEQACAVANGSAVCWGSFVGNWYNEDDHSAPTQVEGLTEDVTALSTNVAYNGLDNACAVASGAVMCWGWSYGAGINGDGWPLVQVEGLTSGATAVATAGYHSCAIVEGGVQCWGDNSSGELGDGTTTESSSAVQVEGLTSGVTAIGVGERSSCAIVEGGVWCWGVNAPSRDDGTPTDGSVPQQVPGLMSGVTALSVGYRHTCVVVEGVAY